MLKIINNIFVDSTWLVCVCMRALITQSCPTCCNTMEAHQTPLSMELARKEYLSGLPFNIDKHIGFLNMNIFIYI